MRCNRVNTIVLLILLSVGLTGCVRRRINITSDPPGALVYLNDQEIGRTPVTVPFRWYGIYDVRLEKEGYQPLWTKQDAEMPWWENPGPDAIAELLPNRTVDLDWYFSLEPKTEVTQADLDKVISHAETMRESNRRPAE